MARQQAVKVPKNLRKFVKKTKQHSPSGVDSWFTPIDEKWGIKFFTDESLRNKSRAFQKTAAKYGLGPKVAQKVSVELPKYTAYGYVSERAETWPFEEYLHHYEYGSYYDDWDIYDLGDKLFSKVGFTFADDHPGNVGLIDGKLVCIDFGE